METGNEVSDVCLSWAQGWVGCWQFAYRCQRWKFRPGPWFVAFWKRDFSISCHFYVIIFHYTTSIYIYSINRSGRLVDNYFPSIFHHRCVFQYTYIGIVIDRYSTIFHHIIWLVVWIILFFPLYGHVIIPTDFHFIIFSEGSTTSTKWQRFLQRWPRRFTTVTATAARSSAMSGSPGPG